MPRAHKQVYDTRFFVEHFYSSDNDILARTKRELSDPSLQKTVSVIALHEFYRLNLERAGRDVALIRTNMIKDDFRCIDVDSRISIRGAEIRKKYTIPMGDSLIAATVSELNAVCVTDDPHIRDIKEIKTRWII